MSKDKTLRIRMTEEDLNRIKAAAEKCGMSASELLRTVTDDYISRMEGMDISTIVDLAVLKKQQRRIETLEKERNLLAKDISTRNCNTCERKNCEHRPQLGELVRANCFMWEKKGAKENEQNH